MKNCICQSCGMPLQSPDIYGTGSDGIQIEDYCIHCYKDGGYTSDVTMEEMMRLCANYVNSNLRDFYIVNMRTLYPHLKRWAKKENTQSEYYKSINKVLDYIKHNLHENADLKTLAEIAYISPYHFHRIFKSVIGESLGEYVTRLRMEYVTEQLKTSALSLAELAEKTGYSSEQSLSRAFKNYFNLPPKTFKNIFFKETFGTGLSPRICKVSSKNIIMLRDNLPDNKLEWQKLYMYAIVKNLLSDNTESLELINKGNYRPALTATELLLSDKHIDTFVLDEGLYAIFTYKGNPAGVEALWAAIHNYWLPTSKYVQSEAIPYVSYLNNATLVAKEDLLMEVYVPLLEK